LAIAEHIGGAGVHHALAVLQAGVGHVQGAVYIGGALLWVKRFPEGGVASDMENDVNVAYCGVDTLRIGDVQWPIIDRQPTNETVRLRRAAAGTDLPALLA